MTSEAELFHGLWRYYQHMRLNCSVVPHASVGYTSAQWREQREAEGSSIRIIDALLLFKDKRWAVEIKISKTDLLKEVSDPTKAGTWARYVHSFYFLVTPELVELAKEVVPKQYGILSPSAGGLYIHTDRRAKVLKEPEEIPYQTWRRLAGNYGKLINKNRERDELERVLPAGSRSGSAGRTPTRTRNASRNGRRS